MRSLLPDSVEELRPAGWEEQLRSANPLRPFSLKHARQQASIVGHMQRMGIAPYAADLRMQVLALQAVTCAKHRPRPMGLPSGVIDTDVEAARAFSVASQSALRAEHCIPDAGPQPGGSTVLPAAAQRLSCRHGMS